MMHLYDRATMAAALTLTFNATLRGLLAERMESLGEELIDFTEYLIIEPGDTEADIARHVGFSPLLNPINGMRYPHPEFHPYWDYLGKHDGWFELIFTYGSTYACILIVQDAAGVDANLLAICR